MYDAKIKRYPDRKFITDKCGVASRISKGSPNVIHAVGNLVGIEVPFGSGLLVSKKSPLNRCRLVRWQGARGKGLVVQ